jgi:Glyoxalase-like domain
VQSSPMSVRIQCLVIDARDCPALARFWAEALGWRVTYEDDHQSVVEPPDGSAEVDVAPDLLFVRVDDEKASKNRLHLDLRPTNQAATVEHLLRLGARHADVGQGDDVKWTVLADPEGNELCVLPPLETP